MRTRDENQDWVRQVPDHYHPRGPYDDYGWERDQSVLPEWRDPDVHTMPYDWLYERGMIGQGGQGAPGMQQSMRRGPSVGMQPRSNEPIWTYTEFWLIPGPFSGRGPQGYQRNDDTIHEEVCERLTQHGQLDARNMKVRVDNGEVTLEGTVNSRRAKRMAEEALDTVPGVKDVHNRLRIEKNQ